jgi:hypothetical protein
MSVSHALDSQSSSSSMVSPRPSSMSTDDSVISAFVTGISPSSTLSSPVTFNTAIRKTPGIGLFAEEHAAACASADAIVSSSDPFSLENSTFKVGDEVEVYNGKQWIPGKLVLVSKRSIIAEYKLSGKSFQKLFRNLENLAKKCTHLNWDELPLSGGHTEPIVPKIAPRVPQAFGLLAAEPLPGLGVNPEENHYLRERAEKQRVANQELVRKHLKLREDFDRLCQEFGELKMQFDTSVETREQHASKLFTADSEGICPHFLKGKCRFKDRCRQSHDIAYCVYCQAKLPSNKVASSAHLSKCYRRMQDWQETSAEAPDS